jgi:hypothetical protein
MTEGIYADYVLDFEFQLAPGANNGLGLHYPGEGNGAYTGIELQILDDAHPKYTELKDYQFHGSIYTLAPATSGGLKPAGEWNQQRVTVLGAAVEVKLNGRKILEANLDELAAKNPQHQGVKRRAGHITWLGHGDRVAFRKIMIGEVAPPAEASAEAPGYKPIFDGKTLSGWKHDPGNTHNWMATNGILKHSGQKGAVNDLWTEASYGDFSLAFHWRWAGRGPRQAQPVVLADGSEARNASGAVERVEIEELDSGIYLRGSTKSQVNLWNWPIGSGEVYGYRTDKAASAEVRAGVTPKTKADRPLGEWNHTVITMKGDRLTVVLNGMTVISEAQLPGVDAQGPIGLQHHGSAIDFANIRLMEL